MSNEIIGRGWAFPPQINSQGELALTGGDSELNQAILIILSTAPGQRVMRPSFGCRLHELVFAPNNAQTRARAQRYVEEAAPEFPAFGGTKPSGSGGSHRARRPWVEGRVSSPRAEAAD